MLSQVPPLGFKGVFFSAPCAALITGLLCLIAAKGRKCVQEVILILPLSPPCSLALLLQAPSLPATSTLPFPVFLMNFGNVHRQQTAETRKIKDGAKRGGSVIGKGPEVLAAHL